MEARKHLQEYILIDQYQILIDIYQRRGDLWKITRLHDIKGSLELASLGIDIAIANIYENISFDNEDY